MNMAPRKRNRIIMLVGLGACLVSFEIVGLGALDRFVGGVARAIGATLQTAGNVVHVFAALSKVSRSIPTPAKLPSEINLPFSDTDSGSRHLSGNATNQMG
jgi:hypothetical protein